MATIEQAKNIAVDFKKFIRQYDVDPHEVAYIINEVLKENFIYTRSDVNIGIDLFDED